MEDIAGFNISKSNLDKQKCGNFSLTTGSNLPSAIKRSEISLLR